MGWRWTATVLLPGIFAACATGEELEGVGGAGGQAAAAGANDSGAAAADASSSGGAAASGGSSGGASGSSGGSSGSSDAGSSGGAAGSASGGSGGTPASGGAGGTTSTGGTGGTSSSACPAGQFATAFSSGAITCSTIDADALATVNASCSAYFGWNDDCTGCTTAPTKWGRAGATTCANGAGADNTCTAPALGSATVQLFGLNTDGGVDNNDKFHLGLHCAAPGTSTSQGVAACPAGELAVGVDGDLVDCMPASDVVLAYARQNCFLYLGWRDSCDGCTGPPTKWGRANDAVCDPGVGSNGTCTAYTLGTETVNLAGVNPGGTVNDDDKFFVGLHCAGAQAAEGTATRTCPAGQIVSAVNADTTLLCTSPAPAIEQALAQGCWFYFGWRDSCDGCTSAPSKWGRVSGNGCENGQGSNATCSVATLGTESVRLFGLNTDGTVGNDDKFYVGLRCE